MRENGQRRSQLWTALPQCSIQCQLVMSSTPESQIIHRVSLDQPSCRTCSLQDIRKSRLAAHEI